MTRTRLGLALAAAALLAAVLVDRTLAQAAERRAAPRVALLEAPAPLAAIAGTPDANVAPGQVVQLAARALGGAGPYLYRWDFGDGFSSRSRRPTHVYSAPGAYLARVTVTDGRGATATAALPLVVREGCTGWSLAIAVSGEPPRGARAMFPGPVQVPAVASGLFRLDAPGPAWRAALDYGAAGEEELNLAPPPAPSEPPARMAAAR